MRQFVAAPHPKTGASVTPWRPGPGDFAGSARYPVSDPEDALEQEADRFADRITRTAEPARHWPLRPPGAGDHPALAGQGQPLPDHVRSFFEPRFGHDFSRVRIHDDQQASRLAAQHDARAFTINHDLVFARGEYAPATQAGQRLLAHELTHVVQQSHGVGLQRQAMDSDAARESELEIEQGREIEQVVGAAPPAAGISRLPGPPRAQRACARPAADAGYPVEVNLDIPATPAPDRTHTTAQISAMAGDGSGRTAGLTRFSAELRWAVSVDSAGDRAWVRRMRVFFRRPSIRIFLTREQARGSCEAGDLERHERRHDADFRANAAEAEKAICDTAGTWPQQRGDPARITAAQLQGLIDDWMAFENWRLEYDNWLDSCTWDTVDYPRLYVSCPGVQVASPDAECPDAPARPEPQHVIPLPDKT